MDAQFEDVVDVLKVLHPYHAFFFFGDSAGYRKKRFCCLGNLSMNRSFCGAQPYIRSSKRHQEEGLMVPDEHII